MVILGVTLQKPQSFDCTLVGFAISNLGLQLVTTPLKMSCIGCHVSQALSALQLINVIQQTISFTIPFWSPNLNEAAGYRLGSGIEVMISVIFYVLSLIIILKRPCLEADYPSERNGQPYYKPA